MKVCTREAFVAGKFYPGTAREIRHLMEILIEKSSIPEKQDWERKKLIGAVLPHAGHIYSGYQTVPLFQILKNSTVEIESFVILHPLHQGGYQSYASDNCTAWSTPLGNMVVDKEFILQMDIHQSDHLLKFEHSAEVLLPFLQFFGFGDKMIIPIGISNQNPQTSREISIKIHRAEKVTGRKIFIIASSDFSHFQSPDEGFRNDSLVIEAIKCGDTDDVYRTILKHDISVCGYGPIMSLMDYAQQNFCKVKSVILSRGHSGQVHPSLKVVDYISLLFYCKNKQDQEWNT